MALESLVAFVTGLRRLAENTGCTVVPKATPEPCLTVIERWARGFWMGAYNGKNMVVALSGYSAYFDASTDQDMLVAGYVSRLEEWAQFEIAWKLTLAQYDVPFFKMSTFIGRRQGEAYEKPKSQI